MFSKQKALSRYEFYRSHKSLKSKRSPTILQSTMANLLPVFDASNPKIGGFIAYFSETNAVVVHWEYAAPIYPVLDAAKQYTASVIQHLIDKHDAESIRDTNWASMTAAVQAMIERWNESLKQHLYGDERAEIAKAVERASRRNPDGTLPDENGNELTPIDSTDRLREMGRLH